MAALVFLSVFATILITIQSQAVSFTGNNVQYPNFPTNLRLQSPSQIPSYYQQPSYSTNSPDVSNSIPSLTPVSDVQPTSFPLPLTNAVSAQGSSSGFSVSSQQTSIANLPSPVPAYLPYAPPPAPIVVEDNSVAYNLGLPSNVPCLPSQVSTYLPYAPPSAPIVVEDNSVAYNFGLPSNVPCLSSSLSTYLPYAPPSAPIVVEDNSVAYNLGLPSNVPCLPSPVSTYLPYAPPSAPIVVEDNSVAYNLGLPSNVPCLPSPVPTYLPYVLPSPPIVLQDNSVANNLANVLNLLVASKLIAASPVVSPPIEYVSPYSVSLPCSEQTLPPVLPLPAYVPINPPNILYSSNPVAVNNYLPVAGNLVGTVPIFIQPYF